MHLTEEGKCISKRRNDQIRITFPSDVTMSHYITLDLQGDF